jgi:hypothetical protein
MGVLVNRRQFLLNAAALAAGIAGTPTVAANLEGQERLVWVLTHPRSVDLPTISYLRMQALDLMRQYEAVAAPTSLLPQAAERLEQITLLREHAPLGRVQQGLWKVETQTATLMGRLTWDVSGQRAHATAARYYDQAIAAASGVKEGWAEAFPRMFQRFLPVYTGDGNPRTGCILPSRQRLGQRMAPVRLLPVGRRPLRRKRMRYLARSGRPGCSWSAPTLTC